MKSRHAVSFQPMTDSWLLPLCSIFMFLTVLMNLKPFPADKAPLLRLGFMMITSTIIFGLGLSLLLYRWITRRQPIPFTLYLRIWLLAILMVGGMMAFIFGLITQNVPAVPTFLASMTLMGCVAILFAKWSRLQQHKLLPAKPQSPADGPEAK